MAKVTFDYSKAKSFVKEEEVKNIESQVLAAKELLVSGTGAGNDFLGWVNLPVDYDKEEFARIQKAAAKIQSDSDVLLVLASAARIWEHVQPSISCVTISTIPFRRRFARLLRFILQEIRSAEPILPIWWM